MNLFSWIGIQAEVMMKDRKTSLKRNFNPQLSIHYQNVADVTKLIKDSGEIIQMTNQAQLVGNDDSPQKTYQSVLYHGVTRSPEKKTFIITKPDGSMTKWTEAIA